MALMLLTALWYLLEVLTVYHLAEVLRDDGTWWHLAVLLFDFKVEGLFDLVWVIGL